MTKQTSKNLIIAVSIVIPIVVAVLFRVKVAGYDFSFLPPVYASINGLTSALLVVALWAIKNNRRLLHERLMKINLVLSLLFLVMYVAYHMTSDSTLFGGEGSIKIIYYFILISHILLSICVIPLVLFTYWRAHLREFDKHKRLARITFPIWLYVAVTGVVVYLMISPYYA